MVLVIPHEKERTIRRTAPPARPTSASVLTNKTNEEVVLGAAGSGRWLVPAAAVNKARKQEVVKGRSTSSQQQQR